MGGSELTKAMAVVVDRMVNIHESTSGLDRAVETVVSTIGCLNGKDIMNYMEAFKAKMLMRDFLDNRQLFVFSQVVIPSCFWQSSQIEKSIDLRKERCRSLTIGAEDSLQEVLGARMETRVILSSYYILQSLHYGGSYGDHGAQQRFGLCTGEEPGRSTPCPVFDDSVEPCVKLRLRQQ